MTTKKILYALNPALVGLLIAILGLVPLLLFPKFDDAGRSLIATEIWNAGHILLFFLCTLSWLHYRKKIARPNTYFSIINILLLGTVIGISIELLQPMVGRDFSVSDIMKNICGILIAIAFSYQAKISLSKIQLRILRLIVVIFTVLMLSPLFMAVIDKSVRLYQYPVLSNLETPFELRRWQSNREISVVNRARSKALKITMLPGEEYNTLDLMHFQGNWEKRHALMLDIYSHDITTRKINIRIHDKQHTKGKQLHSDRFNRQFDLLPGWNKISIPIEDVLISPTNRKIDLRKITNLQLFTRNLSKKWVLYVDNIVLF